MASFIIAYHAYITCTTVLRIALASGVVRWVIERHARRQVFRALIDLDPRDHRCVGFSLHTPVH